jgi:antitoxin (DNA-binding transcriptional repressor) of toxin-antitoxin stability system
MPSMKTMTAAMFKANFSAVVEELKKGNEVVITYGRKKEPLATVIPQSKLKKPNYTVALGDLQVIGWKYQMKDFAMTGEELIGP